MSLRKAGQRPGVVIVGAGFAYIVEPALTRPAPPPSAPGAGNAGGFRTPEG
jgi:hypothetical protein